MKKLLIVTDSYPPNCGGAGIATHNMVNGLIDKGYDIEVITFNKKDSIVELNDKVLVTNFNGNSQFVHRKARKYIKENIERYSIGISTYIHSTRAIADLDLPFITMIHDYWPICYKGLCRNNNTKEEYSVIKLGNVFRSLITEYGWSVKLLSPFLTFYMMWRTNVGIEALDDAEHIIFNSEHCKNKLESFMHWYPGQHVISPPVIYQQRVKRDMGKYLLFVGKFNEYKGKEEIIKLATMIDFNILVIGDHDEDLDKMPENLIFKDYVQNKEVKNYMRNAFAVLVPSQGEESYGMTAQEALNTGTPVICTNKGGVKEIVENRVTGFVVEPNAEEMCLAVSALENKKEYSIIKNNIAKQQINYKMQYTDSINKIDKIIRRVHDENSITLL